MNFQDKNFNWYLSRNLFSSYFIELLSFLLRILRFSRLYLVKKNRILLFYIQLAIAKTLTGCYRAIQEGKIEIKRLKNKIKSETTQKKRTKLKQQLEAMQIRLFAHKNIARILKTIVDGIVWRNMHFDRSILRLIASNRKTGFIDINEPGFRGVINIAKSILWNRKNKVIINDISNFLRVGDLTEISKSGIFIHEIKGKGKRIKNIFSLLQDIKRTSKISKQSEMLLKVQTALSHRKIFIDNSQTVQIRNIKVPFKNYLNDVKKIILKAKREGFFSKKITDYLVVSCLDLKQSVQLKKEGKIKDWKEFKTAEDWESTDFILPFTNTDTFYKNEDFFIPNMTPYSIFPFSSRICLELLSGRLILTARLNISKIYHYFGENGWAVDGIGLNELIKRGQRIKSLYPNIYEAYHFDETLCVLKRGKFNLAIPTINIFRIGMDFMSVETILLEVEQICKEAVPFKDEWTAINILAERNIWK